LQKLIKLVSNLEVLNKIRIIGYILIPLFSILLFIFSIELIWLAIILLILPVIIGLFILRFFDKNINEIKEKIDSIEKDVIDEIQKNINIIADKYEKIVKDDTYLIYSVRTELISSCINYLLDLQQLWDHQ
jgi:hypothetical protein